MFRRYIETVLGEPYEPHSFAEAVEIQDWLGASGTAISSAYSSWIALGSSGTSSYPVAMYYYGHEIVNWTDFFSGRYKSIVFVKCAYCGSTKGKYEYNLLGHPVCVCCGAEIG